MFRTLTAVAAWLSLAFIAYATLSPLNERPEINGLFSHFDHYFGYAVAGGLFAFAYPRQGLFVCIIVFGSAILLELAQLLTPDRHARVVDALRKLIGGVLGIAFARLIISHWFRNRFDSLAESIKVNPQINRAKSRNIEFTMKRLRKPKQP